MDKRGSTIRGVFAIIGAILFLSGLYLLNEDQVLYAGITGIIGILILAIAILPFIKADKIKK